MAKKKGMLEETEELISETAKDIKNVVEEVVEEVEELVKGKGRKKKEDSAEESKEDKISALKEKLKAKAKALEGKVSSEKEFDIKEKVKGEKEEKKDALVPIEDYLKASVHLGTRVITPDMRKFVYRRRADGLAVFNTAMLDDKIKEGAKYLAQHAPKDIVVVCKREAGWKAVNKFAETIGCTVFTKKYPAGILTNTLLDTFFERDLVFICDPWLDKNALVDANKIKIPVLGICDTNNFTAGVNQVIPGNNKSAKSLGMFFYLLTKLYIEYRKLDIVAPTIQEFVEGWDELQAPQ